VTIFEKIDFSTIDQKSKTWYHKLES